MVGSLIGALVIIYTTIIFWSQHGRSQLVQEEKKYTFVVPTGRNKELNFGGKETNELLTLTLPHPADMPPRL